MMRVEQSFAAAAPLGLGSGFIFFWPHGTKQKSALNPLLKATVWSMGF